MRAVAGPARCYYASFVRDTTEFRLAAEALQAEMDDVADI